MFRRRAILLAAVAVTLAGAFAICQAAPRTSRGIIWGKAESGLRLGVSADGNDLVLHVENVGSEAAKVLSHVDSGDTHLPWHVMVVVTPAGTQRKIALSEDTAGANATTLTLQPGQKFSHKVDLVEWSARTVNDSDSLAAGLYFITVVYEVPTGSTDAAGSAWTGKISIGPVKHQIK